MLLKLRALLSRRSVAHYGSPARPAFRPRLEGFEDRVVPAASVNLGAALAAPTASPASLLPINITGVNITDATTGAFTAVGTIGSQPFSANGVLSFTQSSAGATPILNLHLNEIHLNLLGLKVDTSQICLDITAQSGSGNLLGNLLTDVAGLLDGGTPLSGVLGALNTTQLGTLTSGLSDVLNGVFAQLGSQAAASGASTNILHLSLGPVNLDLLGLGVSLDNCNNGPVTVDVSAQSGPGKLLGNLLTSVSHLLDGPANGNAITNALNRVAGEINHLLG
jgi:hypothetical protein